MSEYHKDVVPGRLAAKKKANALETTGIPHQLRETLKDKKTAPSYGFQTPQRSFLESVARSHGLSFEERPPHPSQSNNKKSKKSRLD